MSKQSNVTYACKHDFKRLEGFGEPWCIGNVDQTEERASIASQVGTTWNY